MSTATEAAPAEQESLETETSQASEAFTVDLPDAPEANEKAEEVVEESVEEAAEEPAEPEVAEESQADDFDEALLDSASRYGMAPEEARAYGSPDSLRRAIVFADRQAAQWAKSQWEQGQPQESEQAERKPAEQQQQQAQQQQTQQQQPVDHTPFEKFKVEIDPDEIGEAGVKALHGINDHYDKVVRQQEARLAEMNQYISAMAELVVPLDQGFKQFTGQHQQAEVLTATREIDAFFTGLGDEWADVYGKGTGNELLETGQDNAHLKARNKLLEEMRALEFADARSNRQFSRTERLSRALALLHPDKQKTAARKEILEKSKRRRAQSLNRPSGQRKAATNYESAVQFANEFISEHAAEDDNFGF